MINIDMVNDEVGKIIVIIIIAPILIYKSFILEDLLLGVIGILLFIYDFYWFYQFKSKKKKDTDNYKDVITSSDKTPSEN